MSKKNTPKTGTVLSEKNIKYIPEAHCYLKYKNERIDVTSTTSDFKKIENDLIEEIEIEPFQVSEFKVEFHKNYLKIWLKKEQLDFTFQNIWDIREKCIQNISTSNNT
jgi:hypothetical protein